MTKTRIYFGVSLLILAISFSAKAQTCTPSPDCTSLGYTKTADDCGESVKCPFDTSKVFCLSIMQKITIGAILYSDKTVTSNIVAGKTAIGIVFDTNKRLAVALDREVLTWGVSNTNIPNLGDCGDPLNCGTDGKANTSEIIAYGKVYSRNYPAAEYCNNYTTPGTTAGNWFLPSVADLKSIYNANSYVSASLMSLGRPAIVDSYWSSTETDNSGSWVLNMNNGDGVINGKSGFNFVRAVVAF